MFFDLDARGPTAFLQDSIFGTSNIVCPGPDVVLHPEVLSKEEIVLGIFCAVGHSSVEIEAS